MTTPGPRFQFKKIRVTGLDENTKKSILIRLHELGFAWDNSQPTESADYAKSIAGHILYANTITYTKYDETVDNHEHKEIPWQSLFADVSELKIDKYPGWTNMQKNPPRECEMLWVVNPQTETPQLAWLFAGKLCLYNNPDHVLPESYYLYQYVEIPTFKRL